MKYVKTKDGRIVRVFQEHFSMCEPDDSLTYYGPNTIDFETSRFMPKSDVKDEADDITELLDGYYIEIEGHSYDSCMIYDSFEEAKKELDDWRFYYHIRKEINYDIDLYGFVKTKNGLIFTAKLNNMGGWDLLSENEL